MEVQKESTPFLLQGFSKITLLVIIFKREKKKKKNSGETRKKVIEARVEFIGS